MTQLLHEFGRLARTVPLEGRARWHAWRAVRHHDLRAHHKAALADCMSDVDDLLTSR